MFPLGREFTGGVGCKLLENLFGRNLWLLSLYRIKERQGLEPRWIFEFRDFAWGARGSPFPSRNFTL
jgi:hypothetical protein